MRKSRIFKSFAAKNIQPSRKGNYRVNFLLNFYLVLSLSISIYFGAFTMTYTPFSRKLTVLALSGASILTMVACTTHPNAMPTGYTYHHDTYKSALPPVPSTITVEQRQYMDAAQAEQFRDGTYQLLEKLTMRAGMPPKPVYVKAPNPMNNFYANIDNDLRENMRHIGYALSDSPKEAYVFTYDAQYLMPADGAPMASAGTPNVALTIRVFDTVGPTARMLSSETGQFYIKGAETLNIQPTSYDLMPVMSK